MDLLSSVSHYTACAFRGVGVYQTVKHKTQEAAEQFASNQRGNFLIYAVCPRGGLSHTVHVANIYCDKRGITLVRVYEPDGTQTPEPPKPVKRSLARPGIDQ